MAQHKPYHFNPGACEIATRRHRLWLELRAARVRRIRRGSVKWRCTGFDMNWRADCSRPNPVANNAVIQVSLHRQRDVKIQWQMTKLQTTTQHASPALRLTNSAVFSGTIRNGECEQSNSSVLNFFPLLASACAAIAFWPSIGIAWSLVQKR
jgi:hypothetical protein